MVFLQYSCWCHNTNLRMTNFFSARQWKEDCFGFFCSCIAILVVWLFHFVPLSGFSVLLFYCLFVNYSLTLLTTVKCYFKIPSFLIAKVVLMGYQLVSLPFLQLNLFYLIWNMLKNDLHNFAIILALNVALVTVVSFFYHFFLALFYQSNLLARSLIVPHKCQEQPYILTARIHASQAVSGRYDRQWQTLKLLTHKNIIFCEI